MDTLNTGGTELNQAQREAIIDAVYFCMYADNRLVLAEDKVFADWLVTSGWDANLSVDDYLKTAVLKVRFAKEDDACREQLIVAIGQRLSDDRSRTMARRLCQKVISADGISSDVELRALAELRLDDILR